jgi:hypothetical protein
MYKVSSKECSTDSQEERNFFTPGYEDKEDTGDWRRLQMDVVHQNEAQLAGMMTPKSILKKPKFAAKDTATEGETQEGEGDQINLARMSLAAPTNATTTITTGTQPGKGTSNQQEGKDEGTAFQIRKPSGNY